MSGKNFWQEKWVKDQFNERNPGQRNHPDMTTQKPPLPNPDDVLRVMLNTPPKPHSGTVAPPKTRAPKKKTK